MTKSEKDAVKKEIYEFVDHLLVEEGFSAGSLARAVSLKNSHNVKHKAFGYKTAVRLKEAYVNNYNMWKKEKEH